MGGHPTKTTRCHQFSQTYANPILTQNRYAIHLPNRDSIVVLVEQKDVRMCSVAIEIAHDPRNLRGAGTPKASIWVDNPVPRGSDRWIPFGIVDQRQRLGVRPPPHDAVIFTGKTRRHDPRLPRWMCVLVIDQPRAIGGNEVRGGRVNIPNGDLPRSLMPPQHVGLAHTTQIRELPRMPAWSRASQGEICLSHRAIHNPNVGTAISATPCCGPPHQI